MTIHRRSAAATRHANRSRGGQALVEFSLVLVPFLVILMGIVDLGRGIYMNNGINEAAREIARVTAVHPCTGLPCTLGTSTETLATVATQKGLIPGLGSGTISFSCVTVSDALVTDFSSGSACDSGNYIRVRVTVAYAALTPLLSMVAPSTLSSTAHIQVP
jgi:Flp pilus assembly protein TadG